MSQQETGAIDIDQETPGAFELTTLSGKAKPITLEGRELGYFRRYGALGYEDLQELMDLGKEQQRASEAMQQIDAETEEGERRTRELLAHLGETKRRILELCTTVPEVEHRHIGAMDTVSLLTAFLESAPKNAVVPPAAPKPTGRKDRRT